jgi:hypothetical protein
MVAGALLIVLGALLLARRLVPWFDGDVLWPLALVAVGVVVVASARGRRP